MALPAVMAEAVGATTVTVTATTQNDYASLSFRATTVNPVFIISAGSFQIDVDDVINIVPVVSTTKINLPLVRR